MVGIVLATPFAPKNVELMRSSVEMVWIQMDVRMPTDAYLAAKTMTEDFVLQRVLQCASKIRSNVMVQSRQMVARM